MVEIDNEYLAKAMQERRESLTQIERLQAENRQLRRELAEFYRRDGRTLEAQALLAEGDLCA